eukprot:CAMPEP_0201092150 /NCGR_PEP_ID=MMETSP0812-20130820/707_1 /ASSEMBLY_ACC=CAM_ASM_000668 /TAXON_ID=98059 /ORGANISM="Dinobryon sp., Strain UTEXLB2267" /LENGTH=168 /DNA_ID=CAMNT_0047343553 /DNA_START=109 /DNA_END=615 /DNA_ORIENTATION=+
MLFGNFGRGKKEGSIKIITPSPVALEAISVYQKANPKPKPGRGYDILPEELNLRFISLVEAVKSEEVALKIVSTVPEVLVIKPQLVKDNFAMFESKWGFEKTLGLVTRNPNILSVATRGYGSAEVAGDETLYASYLIAATRPIGKPLLLLLFGLLSKPFIQMLLDNLS